MMLATLHHWLLSAELLLVAVLVAGLVAFAVSRGWLTKFEGVTLGAALVAAAALVRKWLPTRQTSSDTKPDDGPETTHTDHTADAIDDAGDDVDDMTDAEVREALRDELDDLLD